MLSRRTRPAPPDESRDAPTPRRRRVAKKTIPQDYKQRTGEGETAQASMTSASAATVSGASLRLPIASIIFSAMAFAFSTRDSVVSYV